MAWESNAGYLASPRVRAERAALGIDWSVFRDALIFDTGVGLDRFDRLRQMIDEEHSPETMVAGIEA